ncbi:MAG: OmpA family protein [Gemmatimonadota bacterium]
MKPRTLLVLAFAIALPIGGCKKEPPPAPAPQPTANDDDAERRRREAEEAERARREAEARAEAERQRQIEMARSALTALVFFEYNMANLTPDAQRVLRDKVDILRASPAVRLRIEGHADERGSTEYNIALGQRRAEAVRDFFSSFGLDGSRFTLISYGEERPLDSGSNEMAWSRNRRAAFVITAGENDIQPVAR